MIMRAKSLIILLLGLMACFFSCKKAPLTIGKIVTEERTLSDFREVHLYDDVNVTLVRSDTCLIKITTGENIIDNITTEVTNGILTIGNTSTMNWIRTYDYELHATLFFKDIQNFIFSSCGTLNTENQYNSDTVVDYVYRFEVDGGSGDIDMLVNRCNNFKIMYRYGTSRINLHGSDNRNLDILKKSYGILDAHNFDSDTVIIKNLSVGDCYIKALRYIDAEIHNLGDIYYKGNPDNIKVAYGEYAKGRLIKVED